MKAPYKSVAPAQQLKDGDVFDVIGSIFNLYRASWSAFLSNWQTFLVLYLLPASFVLLGLPLIVLPAMKGSLAGDIFALAITFALTAIVIALAPAATVAQFESAHGRKIAFDEAFQKGLPFVVRYFLLSIVLFFMVGFGLILLIIPGLLALFFFGAAPYLLIARNLSITESIRASYEMSRQYWKAVLGVLIVWTLLSLIASIPVLGSPVSFVLGLLYYCVPALVVTRILASKSEV